MIIRNKNNFIDTSKGITIKAQLAFILPLTLSSFLILLTHTLFNSGLARLPDPEIYISAFAVTKSLMHIFQSPLGMTRQTVTSLSNNKADYYKTRYFIIILAFAVVASLAVIALTGASRIIFNKLMGLEGKTLDAAVTMLKIVIIFPGMLGIRDFLSAICIKLRVLRLISIASFLRVIYVIIFVSLLSSFVNISSSVLVGLMFLGSIVVEVLSLLIGTRITQKNRNVSSEYPHPRFIEEKSKALSYRNILSFFSPLALTAYIQTVSMPVINSGLARTQSPEISLSVFAVAWGVGIMVFSPVVIFHQLPLQFSENGQMKNLKDIRKFAIILSSSLSVIMIILSFSNAGYYIIHKLIGASHEISIMSIQVLKFMAVLPFLSVTREFIWGVFMKNRLTKYIGTGKAVNVIVLIASVLFFMSMNFENPALAGIFSIIAAEFAEAIYLTHIYSKKVKQI